MMNGDAGEWRHLCIDMQRMFAEDTPWHVPWLEPVSTNIFAAAERLADQTIFTRFMPPRQAGDMSGRWRTYYEKWWMMTSEHLPAEMADLVRDLREFVPRHEMLLPSFVSGTGPSSSAEGRGPPEPLRKSVGQRQVYTRP